MPELFSVVLDDTIVDNLPFEDAADIAEFYAECMPRHFKRTVRCGKAFYCLEYSYIKDNRKVIFASIERVS